MPKLNLELDTLSVETFAPAAEPELPRAALAATAPNCSAIDACPSRLCTDRCL